MKRLGVDELLTWCIRTLWLMCFIGLCYVVHDMRQPPDPIPHINTDCGVKLP